MTRTATRGGLRLLICGLCAILVLLCLGVVFYEMFYMPESGTAEEKVWLYAKTHGYSLRDYPQSLITLLEGNPETEKFVLEYPAAKDAAPVIDMTEYLQTDTVPLLMQWDQRWGYIKYGSDMAALTGCGPVCLSMAALYVTDDPAMSPDQILRFALENNYYVSGSGSSWTLISEGGVKLGLSVKELPLVKGLIDKSLEEGKPVICAMRAGDFTTSGHYIVLAGIEDGEYRVNDPNSYANSEKLWSYEQIEGQIRNLWSISAGE